MPCMAWHGMAWHRTRPSLRPPSQSRHGSRSQIPALALAVVCNASCRYIWRCSSHGLAALCWHDCRDAGACLRLMRLELEFLRCVRFAERAGASFAFARLRNVAAIRCLRIAARRYTSGPQRLLRLLSGQGAILQGLRGTCRDGRYVPASHRGVCLDGLTPCKLRRLIGCCEACSFFRCAFGYLTFLERRLAHAANRAPGLFFLLNFFLFPAQRPGPILQRSRPAARWKNKMRPSGCSSPQTIFA